jgi:hypothetical protein
MFKHSYNVRLLPLGAPDILGLGGGQEVLVDGDRVDLAEAALDAFPLCVAQSIEYLEKECCSIFDI